MVAKRLVGPDRGLKTLYLGMFILLIPCLAWGYLTFYLILLERLIKLELFLPHDVFQYHRSIYVSFYRYVSPLFVYVNQWTTKSFRFRLVCWTSIVDFHRDIPYPDQAKL